MEPSNAIHRSFAVGLEAL